MFGSANSGENKQIPTEWTRSEIQRIEGRTEKSAMNDQVKWKGCIVRKDMCLVGGKKSESDHVVRG